MTDTARDQAIAQCQAIAAMVAAYEADYERLKELRDLRNEWVADHSTVFGDPGFEWRQQHPDESEELVELEEAVGDCESQEDALDRIQEDPLSIEYRSGWASPGEELTPEEFRIVLCTGGPHVEIVGDVDLSRVRVLYRDWGDSGELFDFDRDAVVTYCQIIGIEE